LKFILPAVVLVVGLSFAVVPLLRGEFFFAMDNPIQNYPHTDFLKKSLLQGVIPHWWFEVGFVAPVVGEGQAAHFFPPRLLLLALFSAPVAFMLEIGLYLGLAGLGTYLFLRELRLHPLACFAGAVGFMFGSHHIIYVSIMSLLRSACFLPWILWS